MATPKRPMKTEPEESGDNPNRTSTVGGLMMIPTFSGARDSTIRVKDFLDTVAQVSNLEGWSDKQTMGAAMLMLRGEAKYFVKGTKFDTFKALHEALLERFDFRQSLSKVLPLLYEQRQRPRESARSFLQRLCGVKATVLEAFKNDAARTGATPVVEAALLSTLIRNVHPERIKTSLINAELQTLDAAKIIVEKAEEVENDFYADKGVCFVGETPLEAAGLVTDMVRSVARQLAGEMSSKKNEGPQPKSSLQGSGSGDKVQKETRECFRCGKKGHLARDCFSKGPTLIKAERAERWGTSGGVKPKGAAGPPVRSSKCFRCAGAGHLASECRVIRCYNCDGLFHAARECRNPKHPSSYQAVVRPNSGLPSKDMSKNASR